MIFKWRVFNHWDTYIETCELHEFDTTLTVQKSGVLADVSHFQGCFMRR